MKQKLKKTFLMEQKLEQSQKRYFIGNKTVTKTFYFNSTNMIGRIKKCTVKSPDEKHCFNNNN